jgi:hypothetical protein
MTSGTQGTAPAADAGCAVLPGGHSAPTEAADACAPAPDELPHRLRPAE